MKMIIIIKKLIMVNAHDMKYQRIRTAIFI